MSANRPSADVRHEAKTGSAGTQTVLLQQHAQAALAANIKYRYVSIHRGEVNGKGYSG